MQSDTVVLWRNYQKNVVKDYSWTIIIQFICNGDFCRHSIKTSKNGPQRISVPLYTNCHPLSTGRKTFYNKNILVALGVTVFFLVEILGSLIPTLLPKKTATPIPYGSKTSKLKTKRRFLKLPFELEAFAGNGGLSFSRARAKNVAVSLTWSRMTYLRD